MAYTAEQNKRINKIVDDYLKTHPWECMPGVENLMYRFRFWFGENTDLYQQALEALVWSELGCSLETYIEEE